MHKLLGLVILVVLLLPYTQLTIVKGAGTGYLAIKDYIGKIWTIQDIWKMYNETTLFRKSDGSVVEVPYGELFLVKVDDTLYTLRNFSRLSEDDDTAVLRLPAGTHRVEVWFGYYHDVQTISIVEGQVSTLNIKTAPIKRIDTMESSFHGYKIYAYSTGDETRIVREDGRVAVHIPANNWIIQVDIDNGETIISRSVSIYGFGYPNYGYRQEVFQFDTNAPNQTIEQEISGGYDFLGIIHADTGTIVKRVANATFINPGGVDEVGVYSYTLLITEDVEKMKLVKHVNDIGFWGLVGELLFVPRTMLGQATGGVEALVYGYRAATLWRAGLTAGTIARGVATSFVEYGLPVYMLSNAIGNAYDYISRFCAGAVTETIVYHVSVIVTNTRVMIIVWGWFTDPAGRIYPITVYGNGLVNIPVKVKAGPPDNPTYITVYAGYAEIPVTNSIDYVLKTISSSKTDYMDYDSQLYINPNTTFGTIVRTGDPTVNIYNYEIGTDYNKYYFIVDDIRQYTITLKYSILWTINDAEFSGSNINNYMYVAVKITTNSSEHASAIYNLVESKGFAASISGTTVTVKIVFTTSILDTNKLLFYATGDLGFTELGIPVPANITIGLMSTYPSGNEYLAVRLSGAGTSPSTGTLIVSKIVAIIPMVAVPIDIVQDGFYKIGRAIAVEINHVRISYDDEYILGIYLLEGSIPDKIIVVRTAAYEYNISNQYQRVIYTYLVLPSSLFSQLSQIPEVTATSRNIYVKIPATIPRFENTTFMFIGENSWSILYLPPDIAAMIWEPAWTPPHGYGLDIVIPSGQVIAIANGDLYIWKQSTQEWLHVSPQLVNTTYNIVDDAEQIQATIPNNTVDTDHYYKYVENTSYEGWLWNDNLTLRMIVASKYFNTLPDDVFKQLWEQAQPTPPQIYITLFDNNLLNKLTTWWNQNWKWLLLGLGGLLLLIILLLGAAGSGRRIVVVRR